MSTKLSTVLVKRFDRPEPSKMRKTSSGSGGRAATPLAEAVAEGPLKRKAIVIDDAENLDILVNIMGLDMKEHRLDVLRSDTIGEVKARVMKYHPNIPSDALCLMYGDKKLEEWARVKDYNIVDGDKMEMWRVACYDRECAMSGGSYLTAADYVELLNFTSWG